MAKPHLDFRTKLLLFKQTTRLRLQKNRRLHASAAKQAGLQKLGGETSYIAKKTSNTSSGANGAGQRPMGNNQNETWRETGSQPERPPKGSLDPTRDTNEYLFLSSESMDSLDVIDAPDAAAGSSKGREFVSSKKPS